MNPERWEQLKHLFEETLRQDPSERAGFLRRACAGDATLQGEVESLLANYASKDSFLERPVYEEAAELLHSNSGASQIGVSYGPYVVRQKIGEGGMGVVYLAQDTRLDRPVALKALAPGYTNDAQFRERLRREAKLAARLGHPGIATVYALEEFGGHLYIVSEYVQGRTLKEELRGGPMPLPTVLDVATQVLRALVAAHEGGIIHRDLKPENIIRTPEGTVKILDFGLARSRGPEFADAPATPTLTKAGSFVGTPAYSSPEQLLGSEVDFRTDLFSFGVLLYELASGTHPFYSTDPISMAARILESEPPPLITVRPEISPELDRIVHRCLRKERVQRYPATRQLLADVELLSSKVAPTGRGRISGPARAERRSANPFWWWQFHQAFAGFGYYAMLYPLWRAKQWAIAPWGALFFFPCLAAIGISANLRLHLWFTSGFYPDQLTHQRRIAGPWIRWADALFVLSVLAAAGLIHEKHATIATLLVGVAVFSLVGFALIEPTTTRAAFREEKIQED